MDDRTAQQIRDELHQMNQHLQALAWWTGAYPVRQSSLDKSQLANSLQMLADRVAQITSK